MKNYLVIRQGTLMVLTSFSSQSKMLDKQALVLNCIRDVNTMIEGRTDGPLIYGKLGGHASSSRQS